MKNTYLFTTTESPALDQVGGKALSLIKMTREGMPVPSGFILTVNFFKPWIKVLQNKPEWSALKKSNLDELSRVAKPLQLLCDDLRFNHEQKRE